jgi:hypothetical protein
VRREPKPINGKDGPRTLVDVATLKTYCANLPKKADHAPIGTRLVKAALQI